MNASKRKFVAALGELNEKATEEEVKICEMVTGVPYNNLWKAENAR
jgi:hypothetical protein